MQTLISFLKIRITKKVILKSLVVKLVPINIVTMDIKCIVKNLIMKIKSEKNKVEP
jgi:hypothetical protein